MYCVRVPECPAAAAPECRRSVTMMYEIDWIDTTKNDNGWVG